jgi:hypothetical protein
MMKRRDFVKKSVAGMAAGLAMANENAYSLVGQAQEGKTGVSGPEEKDRLFPSGLPELEWQEFHARGFSKPVSGVIYRTKALPSLWRYGRKVVWHGLLPEHDALGHALGAGGAGLARAMRGWRLGGARSQGWEGGISFSNK